MLFLLAMEPLHRLFKRAQELGMLTKIGKCCDRISMYADDDVVFIRPTEHGLSVSNHILVIFAEASGLIINLGKTEFYLIQCGRTDLSFLTSRNLAISAFPYKYLGLPLHYKKPSRAMLQHIIQKIGNRLSDWKRNLFTYPGREVLVKIVLTAMPTFFLTVFKMRKWAISRIDKFRRGFLWKGHDGDNIRVGHCLLN
jgi:hypothetical protein